MIPHIIDYRPVYASEFLTVQDCIYMHSILHVNTTVSGDLTTARIEPFKPATLTSVARGTGF